MFMLTQLALTKATSNTGCQASCSHVYIFSKRAQRFGGMLHSEKNRHIKCCGSI